MGCITANICQVFPGIGHRFCCVWALFLASLVCLNAQQPPVHPFSALLAAVETDPALKAWQNTQDWSASVNWKGSYLREWDVRYRNDDFLWNEQAWMLRVSPRGIGERSAAASLYAARAEASRLAFQAAFAQQVAMRYEAAASWYMAQQYRRLWQEIASVHQQKIALITAQAGETGFEPDELSDAETEWIKARQQAESFDAVCREIGQQFALWSDVPFALSDSGWISPEGIESALRSLPDSLYWDVSIVSAEQELREAQLEARHDAARSRRWIGFVQGRYAQMGTGKTPELSLGFSLNLPRFADERVSRARHELDIRMADAEYQAQVTDAARVAWLSRRRLEQSLSRWRNTRDMIAQGSTDKTFAWAQRQAAPQPMLLLALREQQCRQQLLLWQAAEAAYENWLEWLSETGRMAALPLVNYLSPGLEK